MQQPEMAALCALIASLVGFAPIQAEIARTAGGKPDLTGTYNVSTLTPLQRPSEFGDSLELTPAQAEKITAANKAAMAEANRNRGAATKPPAGGAAPVGRDDSQRENSGAGNVGGYNFFWTDRGTDVNLVDGKFRTSILYDPPNGRMPDLTPAARQRFAERRKLRRPNDGTAWWVTLEGPGPYDGPESLGTAERCIIGFTGATPTFPSLYNNHKRIVQTEDHVMILIEMVHDARIVRLNSEHKPDTYRSHLGDSIGWWEGDTLVVDTTNFIQGSAQGRGGSVNMHVVERFTPTDDGNINYKFTVEDSTVWTASWSGEYVWRAENDAKVYEYACHEGNYSMGGILRGARLLEAEALGTSAGGGAQ
ncbi:MAG: hypothetical protein AAF541_15295 [Pseudomonadota bacterium]